MSSSSLPPPAGDDSSTGVAGSSNDTDTFLAAMLPVIVFTCILVSCFTIMLCRSRCERRAEDYQPPPPPCQLPPSDVSALLSAITPHMYTESSAYRSETCVICLDELTPQVSIVKQLRCGHTFHCDCIDQWLANSKHCPLCLQHVAVGRDVRRPELTQQLELTNCSTQALASSEEADDFPNTSVPVDVDILARTAVMVQPSAG